MKENLANGAEIINTFKRKDYPIKILYLCLCKTSLSDKFFKDAKEAECVFLKDFDLSPDNDKKIIWDKTKSILESLFSLAVNFEKPSVEE